MFALSLIVGGAEEHFRSLCSGGHDDGPRDLSGSDRGGSGGGQKRDCPVPPLPQTSGSTEDCVLLRVHAGLCRYQGLSFEERGCASERARQAGR